MKNGELPVVVRRMSGTEYQGFGVFARSSGGTHSNYNCHLCAFLQFVTGSNIIAVDSIEAAYYTVNCKAVIIFNYSNVTFEKFEQILFHSLTLLSRGQLFSVAYIIYLYDHY